SASSSCLERERLQLPELGDVREVALELAQRNLLDVNEAGFQQRVAKRLRVVDEAVAPRAEEVVDDHPWQRRGDFRLERVDRPADVPLGDGSTVVQDGEAVERRGRPAGRPARAENPAALQQSGLP